MDTECHIQEEDLLSDIFSFSLGTLMSVCVCDILFVLN